MGNTRPSVMPLIAATGPKGEHVGSAVFVTLGPHPFVLTAGHVFDWSERGDLFVPVQGRYVPLPKIVLTSGAPGADRKKDAIDFAHFLLPPPIAQILSQSFVPIQLANRPLGDARNPGHRYAFVGFPCAMNSETDLTKPAGLTRAVVLQGSILKDSDYRKLKIQKAHHIAIRYDQKPRKHRDDSIGTCFTPPHPEGMSGGAVLSAFFDPKTKRPIQAQLVGIIIDHQPGRIRSLIASRIEFPLASIREAYPWVRPFMPRFLDHDIEVRTEGVPQSGASTTSTPSP